MREQRTQTVSRRALLGTLAGGVSALSGCSSVLGRGQSTPVSVLCAGSLQRTLSGLDARVSERVELEAKGSAAAARLVADGLRDPDLLVLADTVLFDSILGVLWYARVATSELTVAYDRTTDAGRRLEDADRWFDPLLAGEVRLGRTDPDVDPLGYRTLFALELAAAYYDRPDLATTVRERSDIYPETSLLTRMGTGAVDAAIVYRPMALDHGFDTIDLPTAIDLSDPATADRYATASYTLPDGTVVTGGPIEYGATVRNRTDGAMAAFDVLTDGELLADHGFRTPDRYPTYEGDVPDSLTR